MPLISGLCNCIHYFCVGSIVYEDADDYDRMPFLEILQDQFKKWLFAAISNYNIYLFL